MSGAEHSWKRVLFDTNMVSRWMGRRLGFSGATQGAGPTACEAQGNLLRVRRDRAGADGLRPRKRSSSTIRCRIIRGPLVARLGAAQRPFGRSGLIFTKLLGAVLAFASGKAHQPTRKVVTTRCARRAGVAAAAGSYANPPGEPPVRRFRGDVRSA